jgi:flagellar protein FlaG
VATPTQASDDAIPDIRALADELGLSIVIRNLKLQFEVEEDARSVVVRVFDSDTKELIRQIPPEEFIEFSRHLEEMIGVLFDRQV